MLAGDMQFEICTEYSVSRHTYQKEDSAAKLQLFPTAGVFATLYARHIILKEAKETPYARILGVISWCIETEGDIESSCVTIGEN